MKKKKYILFISLGDWYLPLLKKLKKNGFKIIVTNIKKNSKCLKFADKKILCDSRKFDFIIEFIKKNKLQNKILYVYCGNDFSESASKVAKFLKISWHSSQASSFCQNKHLQRVKLKKHKILIPEGISIKSFSQLKRKKYKFKNKNIIVKPSDSSSAQGIRILSNINSLSEKIFNNSIKFSKKKQVVIEEFIDGTLHDINGLIFNKKFYPMGINDKKPGKKPYAVVTKIKSPTKLKPREQKKLYEVFYKACKALGLGPGPVKGDFIKGLNKKFYTMEIGARLHGPLGIIYLIPLSLNLFPFDQLMNVIEKRKVVTHDIYKKNYIKVKINASDKRKIDTKIEKKNKIIILKKPGIYNSKRWKSNYDVPIYKIIK